VVNFFDAILAVFSSVAVAADSVDKWVVVVASVVAVVIFFAAILVDFVSVTVAADSVVIIFASGSQEGPVRTGCCDLLRVGLRRSR